ncbi:MAG: hypothetical protein RIB43_10420 [Rhodospirillaceae bacterium]
MLRRLTKALTASFTAFSLAVALVVSVFAQSHPAAGAQAQDLAAAPCAEHSAPQPQDFWGDACASVCDATDLDMLLGVPSDRSTTSDLTFDLFIYDQTPRPSLQVSRALGLVTGHDPPGSQLYLTTQRLRL